MSPCAGSRCSGADALQLRHLKDAFKKDDKDVPWYRKHAGLDFGVELEAMPSTELRDRVERAIRHEIGDVAAWNRVMAASRVVRDSWEVVCGPLAAAVYSGARVRIDWTQGEPLKI